MNLAKLPVRTDFVEAVYQALVDAISAGQLAPGTRLTQEDLAEQFQVSRSPVLQAMRLLKKDGLLQDAPGRGMLVAPLDPAWTGQLYQVRGALDALAARLAAQRRAQLPASLITQGRAAALSGDLKAMIDADSALHCAIYEASGNPLIVQSASLHWLHLRRVMGAVLQQRSGRSGIWDEHEAICLAIARGDAEAAAQLSWGHAEAAGTNLVESLQATLARDQHARA